MQKALSFSSALNRCIVVIIGKEYIGKRCTLLCSVCSKSGVIGSSTVYDSVLLHFSAQDIAKELTLIDRGLLIRLDYREIVNSLRDHTLCAEQASAKLLFPVVAK